MNSTTIITLDEKIESTERVNNPLSELTMDERLERYFTSCHILPRYDVITFQGYLYTDSFVFRRYKHEGYDFLRHSIILSDRAYQPSWNIDTFKNIQTDNPIIYMMSDRLRDKHYRTMYMVKIHFHSEQSPLSINEINQFLELIRLNYKMFLTGVGDSIIADDIRIIEEPILKPSKVEISLDFIGDFNAIHFLHENLYNNLYKARTIKRKPYEPEDDEQSKPFYTFDGRVLYGIYPTHYISNCYRDYIYEDKEGNEIFRLEMILSKPYLERNCIYSADAIENIDKPSYWVKNYFFIDLNYEGVSSYVDKKYPAWGQSVRMLLNSVGYYTPYQIYEKLKSDYKINGKSLFGYPSRFLKTKWRILDGMIQSALNRLTLSENPINSDFQPMIRKRDKTLADRGRKSRWNDIAIAVESLKQRGIKPTYKAIAQEANITEKSIAKYKEALKDLLK